MYFYIFYCNLISKYKRTSHVSMKSKLLMYKSYIRPLLTYACRAYKHIAKSHIKKLQVQQNRTFRMVLNAHYRTRIKNLHKSAKVPMIENYIEKLTEKFFKRSYSSENSIIKRLGVTKLSATTRTRHNFPRRN